MKNWIVPVIAILLIAAGIFGLTKGKLSYTEETHEAEVAGIELSVKDKETVGIPKWAAGGAIAVGALLLVVRPHEALMLEMRTGSQPRAVDVIVGGGLAAGLLDIVNAIVFWRLYSGTSATLILQSVAAGVQGKAAFAGGATSAAFGLALHFLIMFGMATVYWLACRRWPWMIARPIAAGVAYGLLTWIAMNYVIVPLSRAASSPRFILSWFIDGLLAHVLLVGLLFAFVARWSAARANPGLRRGRWRGTCPRAPRPAGRPDAPCRGIRT